MGLSYPCLLAKGQLLPTIKHAHDVVVVLQMDDVAGQQTVFYAVSEVYVVLTSYES